MASISASEWQNAYDSAKMKRMLSPKEEIAVKRASPIPSKIPDVEQSYRLLKLLERLEMEGFKLSR